MDDTLLLGRASPQVSTSFKADIDSFCMVSGGIINASESQVYGGNISIQELRIIARNFDFQGNT